MPCPHFPAVKRPAPLNLARGSGERCKPARQTLFIPVCRVGHLSKKIILVVTVFMDKNAVWRRRYIPFITPLDPPWCLGLVSVRLSVPYRMSLLAAGWHCQFHKSINQSNFIFWAIEILQCIQCMQALKRLPEKHTLIKLAAQTNKRTQIWIQTGRERDGEQTLICAVQVQVQTQSLINLQYVHVQSGLK